MSTTELNDIDIQVESHDDFIHESEITVGKKKPKQLKYSQSMLIYHATGSGKTQNIINILKQDPLSDELLLKLDVWITQNPNVTTNKYYSRATHFRSIVNNLANLKPNIKNIMSDKKTYTRVMGLFNLIARLFNTTVLDAINFFNYNFVLFKIFELLNLDTSLLIYPKTPISVEKRWKLLFDGITNELNSIN